MSKKKLLAIVLTLVMVLSLVPQSVFADAAAELGWENAAGSDESATIHWGTINGDTFKEFTDTATVDSSAGSISLDVIFDGYLYSTASYKKGDVEYAIDSKILTKEKAEDGSTYWTMQAHVVTGEEGSPETVIIEDGAEIYVNYVEKSSGYTPPDPSPAEVKGPITEKNVTPNGDGTYTIRLDITGQQDHTVNRVGANVIVILDRTQSMSNRMGNSTRMAAAREALQTLISTLDPGTAEEGKNLINFTVVGFANSANYYNELAWTQTRSEMLNYATTVDYLSGNAGLGTSWQAGLYGGIVRANDAATDNTLKGNKTYVIFVTDGNPNAWYTRPNSDGGPSNSSNFQQQGSGQFIEAAYNASIPNAVNLSNLVGNRFYGVYCGGANDDGKDHLTDLMSETNNGSSVNGTFIDGTSEDAIKAAFKDIANTIVSDLGASNTVVDDGIPTLANVSSSVSGTAGGFKYYITPKNGTESEWEGAPSASYSSSNGVTWDLSAAGVLADGTTYSLEFTVWPSQAAYDLVADLNNGLKDYDSLPADQKAAVTGSKETGYTLKTNTHLNTTYTYGNKSYQDLSEMPQTAMDLPSEYFSIYKDWQNLLPQDSRFAQMLTDKDGYLINKDETQILVNGSPIKYDDERAKDYAVYYIDLIVTQGENDYTDVRLTSKDTPSWTYDKLYVAPGFMNVGDDNKLTIKETGHDYSVKEKPSDAYYWELHAETYHPMVIDGESTMLILVTEDVPDMADNTTTTDGTGTYYKFGGKVYKAMTADAKITAVNMRRSYLNLTKKVTGTGADANEFFTFTIKMNNPNGLHSGDEGYDAEADGFWFSAFDPVYNATVMDLTVTGATPEEKGGQKTGYWYFDNGGTITVKIKANWNIRFTNLFSGTTYEITEDSSVMSPGFAFSSIDAEAVKEGAAQTYSPTKTNEKISGEIEAANTVYTVTYNNVYALKDVTFYKKWEDNNSASRPSTTEFAKALTLKVSTGSGYSEYKTANDSTVDPTVEDISATTANTYKITYTGLPANIGGKAASYRVEEDVAALGNYEANGNGYADENGTITNTKTTATLTITKSLTTDSEKVDIPTTTAFVISGPTGFTDPGLTIANFTKNNDGTYTYTIEVPAGSYTVTETASSAKVPGYDLTVGGDNGKATTLEKNGTATIAITNKYVKKTGTNTVHDSVTFNKVDQDDEALEGATFTLSNGAATRALPKTYSTQSFTVSTNDDDLAALLPAAGSSVTLTLAETTVPKGYAGSEDVTITITATANEAFDAEQDAFITTTTYAIGVSGAAVPVADAEKTYNIVNTLNTATLVITKVFEGIPAESINRYICIGLIGTENGQQVYKSDGLMCHYEAMMSSVDPNGIEKKRVVSDDKLTVTFTLSYVPVGLTINASESSYEISQDGIYTIDMDKSTTTADPVVIAEAGNTYYISFKNVYKLTTNYVLIEKSLGEESEQVTIPSDVTFNIKDEEGNVVASVTYADLTDETKNPVEVVLGKYTVEETNADIPGYSRETTIVMRNDYVPPEKSPSRDAKGEDAAAASSQFEVTRTSAWVAVVTNTYTKDMAKLTISKVLGNGSEQVTIPEGTTFTITGKATSGEDVNKTITYAELGDKEKNPVVVPVGEYTVTETLAEVDGYSLITTVTYPEDGNKVVLTKESNTAEVTVTNTYSKDMAKLTIKKVLGEGSEQVTIPEGTTFTITGKATSGEDVEKTITYAELADQEKNPVVVPVGEYTVSESGADLAGYSLTTEVTYPEGGKNVVLTRENNTAEVTVTNTYTKDMAKLTIKKVLGEGSDQVTIPEGATFTITGKATSGEDVEKTITYKDLADAEKNPVVVPVGEYTVTETEAGIKGYTLETTYTYPEDGKNVVLTKENNTAEVTVTNVYTKDMATLTLEKVLGKDSEQVTIPGGTKFTITGETVSGEAWTKTVTYDELQKEGGNTFTVPTGKYSVTEDTATAAVAGYTLGTPGYSAAVTLGKGAKGGLIVTNTYTKDMATLKLTKTASGLEGTDVVPDDAKFVISAVGGKTISGEKFDDVTVTYKDIKDGKWSMEVPTGTYTVEETGADVVGYTLETKYGADVELKKDGDEGTLTVTNTYTRTKIKITVTKVWADEFYDKDDFFGLRPDSVKFTVTGSDGTTYEAELKGEGNTWTAEVEVPEYTNGEKNTFTVDEEKVTAGYAKKIDNDKLTITNTFAPCWGDPPVMKELKGDTPIKAETYVFKLTAVSNTAGLDKMPMPEDAKGAQEMTMEVTEVGKAKEFGKFDLSVPGTYTYTITEVVGSTEGFTYSTETHTIVYEVTANEETNALECVKKVDGVVIDGDETDEANVSKFTITNTYTKPVVEVKVTKVWEDGNNEDGNRPATVTVHLLADGKDTGKTLVLGETTKWEGTFEKLDKYGSDGKAITYTVKEDVPKDYIGEVTGDMTKGFVITNTADVPDTGDHNDMFLWSGAMITSLLAVVFLASKKRKEEQF